MDNHLELWLDGLAVDEDVLVDTETVYLRRHPDGAELGLYLVRGFTPTQLEQAARAGFHSARHFDAGLAVSGEALVLSRWLPGAAGWRDAAAALESILNQCAMVRAWLAGSRLQREPDARRQEQRIRDRVGALR